ncbi:MAG: hypothetical protein ACLS95_00935 [Clostridia bacterium]
MKMLMKKGILQKTIMVMLTILLLNFILPTYSQASFGGVLAGPLIDLLASVGDSILGLLQTCMGASTRTDVRLSTNPFMVDVGELGQYGDINADGAAATSTENEVKKEDLDLGWFGISNTYSVPIVTYSPEQIFSGRVPGLDINFINPNKYESDGEEVDSSAKTLQPVIAKWYIALRNLSIVGLMCVLVYIGIRILLTSTAADKAKYKQLFTDWLIALCLLFFLHYIMSFTLTMVDAINDSLSAGQDGNDHNGNNIIVHVDDGNSFRTNLLGSVRFKTQYKDFFPRLQYLIVYLILVGYTAMFTWTYLKRLLNMAFLTIIAPLVALTYPIDKISDGQAQAFNTWLKEFVYNALLQPFHYIIYMVLVGSAASLIETNFIYAIAALAFIMSAEKILRNIFGFNKAGAGTVGALGGFTGGAIASQLLNSARSAGKRAGGKKDTGGSDKPSPELPNRVRNHDASELDFSNVGDSTEETRENPQPSNSGNNNQQGGPEGEAYDDFQQQLQNPDDGTNQNLSPEELAEQDPNYMYMHPELFQDQGSNTQGGENDTDQSQTDDTGARGTSGSETQEQMDNRNNIPSDNQKPIKGVKALYNRHFAAKKGGLAGAAFRQTAKLARSGLRVGGTVAGISAGAIAGIASGKGLGGMLTGAAAGAAVGRGIGDKLGAVPGAVGGAAVNAGSRIKEGVSSNWATFKGTEMEHDQQRMEKEFMKNEENRKAVADKIYKETGNRASREDINKRMESLKPYAKEGLSDINEMMKAQKVEGKYHIDGKQSAKIAAMAKERGITAELLNDKKKYEARLEDMTQEWEDKGLDRGEAQKRASYVLNVMKAQNGQRNNLRKIVKTPENNSANNNNNNNSNN